MRVPVTFVLTLALLGAAVGPVVLGDHAPVALPGWEQAPLADGFDFAVGPPDAEGYFDAQRFGRNDHLGEDWNGLGGGATDRGDPVHAIATGYVTFADDVGGGWGNVVRVVHRYEEAGAVRIVESLYAHLDTVTVGEGTLVSRGEIVGTLGDAGGVYSPHLHLELRDVPDLPLGGGYARDREGWLSPKDFIAAHRPPERR